MIPDIITKKNFQLFIREECLEKMGHIFKNDIKSENDADDISEGIKISFSKSSDIKYPFPLEVTSRVPI